MLTTLLTLLPLLALPALGLSDDEMRQRSVYQLITDRFALPNNSTTSCDTSARKYCGGTWQTIIDHLDYIKGMGFDTVWISPVVENIGDSTPIGEAYHGYWTLNPANLNSHFGSQDDLKALSKALHDKGMYLQLDVVINHVAATSSSTFQPSSSYGQFSQSTDYHPFCWVEDYTNQTQVEQCWLGDSNVALPDLNTENADVQSYWNTWLKKMISDYSVDTIRIDTVKHVAQSEWKTMIDGVSVFNQGEVLNDDPTYISGYQKNASINPFNYAVYYPITFTFNSTSFSMDQLIGMVDQVNGNFTDPTLLGTFLNNHDNPRFESYQTDKALIKNAHAYPLVTDGIPYVYYGSEAGFNGGADPANREPLWTTAYNTSQDMYRFFTSLNAARSAAGAASSSFYTTRMNLTGMTSNELLVAKGPLVSLLSNRGAGATSPDITIPVAQTKWTPNSAVIDAVSCNTFTTNSGGDLVIKIENGLPRVLIAESQKGKVCDPSLFTNQTSLPASNGTSGNGGKQGGAAQMTGMPLTAGLAGALGLVAAQMLL